MAALSQQPTTGRDWEEVEPRSAAEGGAAELYRVELPVFEGPLDLLLHLIRKHEIDIFDIPVALIMDKYLAYLEWMRVLDIDIASDFLVMASTLAHIKSRMLLPPDQSEGEDEEEEPDPREELVRRLLEYQRYKEAADELRNQPILYRDVFTRGSRAQAVESDSPFAEVSVYRLIEALNQVIKQSEKKIGHRVTVDRISIADRIQELTTMLRERCELTFEELFADQRTRDRVVATFLALLEMARLHMVRIHQAVDSDVIHVRGRLEEVDVEQTLAQADLDE